MSLCTFSSFIFGFAMQSEDRLQLFNPQQQQQLSLCTHIHNIVCGASTIESIEILSNGLFFVCVFVCMNALNTVNE